MRDKLQKIHPHAAGIDIGSEKVFVGLEEKDAVSFRTFTSEYARLVSYLVENQIETVAMESTGVYWVSLYDMIEQAGIEVYLVTPSQVRMVPGRKTDVQDCQWLQQLHSYGLLSKSVIPNLSIRELKSLVRLREDHIEQKSMYVNKMQKALTLMNIRLREVISQVHGKSGMKIMKAILSGERDAEKLTMLCEKSILKKKKQDVIESLNGFYNQTNLFELKQAVDCFQYLEMKIAECDRELDKVLTTLTCNRKQPEKLTVAKKIRHNAPAVEDIHRKIVTLCGGVDPTALPGITDYNLMKIMAEIGGNIHLWPSEKHFTSWLGLSPGKNDSGKSIRRRSRRRINTKAGQIFKESAHSLLASKHNALGHFARKLRGKKGAPIAIKATARKLAEMFWRLLAKGLDYVEIGIKAYEEKQALQLRKYLDRKAKELNLQIVDLQPA